jgi:hypothetical protein
MQQETPIIRGIRVNLYRDCSNKLIYLYHEGNTLVRREGNNMNLVPVLFRGKIKYLKPENIEWVRENIRDPKETMEQAIERLYVEGVRANGRGYA